MRPKSKTFQAHSNTFQPQNNHSENKLFSSLCKVLFRSLQLEYHHEKWQTTPRDRDKHFNNILDKITPPQPNPEFRRDIQAIIKKAGILIKERVQTHLQQKMEDNNKILTNLNPLDLNKAGDIVHQQIEQRFSCKIYNIKDQISKYKGMVGTALISTKENTSEVQNPLPTMDKESHTQLSQHMVATESISNSPEICCV